MVKGRESAAAAEHVDPVSRFDSAPGWGRALTVALFLIALICVVMPEIALRGDIFLVPDTKAPISFSEVGRAELERGSYPMWNPYIFGGMPSYHSLSYNPYVYPVSFLTYVLQEYLRFPEMTWLLIHYIMAGIGVYLLMRSFGVRSSVSLLAGSVFMLMPNFLAIGANGHGSQACAIAYMPFALLFTRNLLAGRGRLLNAGLLAVVLGFQTLRGHIQISYYTYALVGLVVIFESVYMVRKGRVRKLGADLAFLAAALVLAMGISAVLVLPVREYAHYSIRGGANGLDYDYATGWSLHPAEMSTFLFPWAYGFGKGTYWGRMPFTDYPNYVGMLTAVFAVIAVYISRSRWRWYMAAAAVIATLISFGRHFPLLYDPMFRFLPFFDKFRVPVMILIVQQMLLVTMAGIGMEEYLRRREAGTLPKLLGEGRLKWVMTGAAALLVIVLVAGGSIRQGIMTDETVMSRIRPQLARVAASGYANDLARTALVLTACAAVLFLSAWKRVRPGIVVLSLAVIALFDMLTVSRPVIHPEEAWNVEGYRIIQPLGAREEYKRENLAAGFLSKQEPYFRVFPVPYARPGTWSHNAFPFSDNSYMMSGIFSMGGYHAAKLKNYQEVMDVMFATFNSGRVPKQILNMMNARYFISLQKLSWERLGYELVHSEERNYIYSNPAALPRVFFVDKVKAMPRREALMNLVSPAFDPSREVLVEKLPEGEIESAEGSYASITEYRLNSIRIDAHVERPCIMVLSEIYYPDWKAEVDGREVPVFEADCCLRALVLGPGDHEVTLRFDSPVMKRSLVISIIALAVSLLMVASSRFITLGKAE